MLLLLNCLFAVCSALRKSGIMSSWLVECPQPEKCDLTQYQILPSKVICRRNTNILWFSWVLADNRIIGR